MGKPEFEAVQLHLTESQMKKIHKAVTERHPEITIEVSHDDIGHPEGHTVHLGKRNFERIVKAQAAGHGCRIKFTKTELKHNSQHGGFLPLIASLLSNPIVSAVAAPLVSGIVSKGVDLVKGLFSGGEKPKPSRASKSRPQKQVIPDDNALPMMDANEGMDGSGLHRGGLLYPHGEGKVIKHRRTEQGGLLYSAGEGKGIRHHHHHGHAHATHEPAWPAVEKDDRQITPLAYDEPNKVAVVKGQSRLQIYNI